MAKNYTPLDLKKFGHGQKDQKEEKHISRLDAILISIIIITLIVFGVLLFMLYQKSM